MIKWLYVNIIKSKMTYASKLREYGKKYPNAGYGQMFNQWLSRKDLKPYNSLGYEDTIGDGEVQWMTAASGIMHEEKFISSKQLAESVVWSGPETMISKIKSLFYFYRTGSFFILKK